MTLPSRRPKTALATELTKGSAAVFVATATVNFSTFLIMTASGLFLPIEEFARLAVIVASTVLATMSFDFGLNITVIRKFNETQDNRYLLAPLAIRILLLPAAAILSLFIALAGFADVAVGVVFGAFGNLWSGARATDQARRDYRSFFRSSALVAFVRVSLGMLVVVSAPSALVVGAAIYAAPILLVVGIPALMQFSQALAALGSPSRRTFMYASQMYIAQLTFASLPYVPQFIVDARLSAMESGAYGLAIASIAPAALVLNSVRNVVLPKFASDPSEIDAFLWSRRGVLTSLLALALLVLLGAALGLLLALVFGDRYPAAPTAAFVLFVGTVATGIVGMYGLSAHLRDAAHLVVIVNASRLTVLLILLEMLGGSILVVTASTAVVMFIGELALVSAVALRRRSERRLDRASGE